MVYALIAMGVALAAAAGLGAWLGRQPGRRGWQVAVGVAAVPAALLALFPVAQVLRSDALGWVAGLSLMALGAFGLPLTVGLAIGWFWARGRGAPPAAPPSSGAAASVGAAAPSDPVADAARADMRARQRGLLMAIAGVGAGFWVGIALGFRLHDQTAPASLDAGLPLAAVVLVLTLAAGLRWLWRRRPRPRPQPARAAPGVVSWSGGALDATASPCCRHLVPLVAAMREAGIGVRPDGPRSARAECLVDAPSLGVPAEVVAEEFVLHERSAGDGRAARLRCTACESTLWVLHPAEAPAAAAWYPAPPANAR